MDERIIKIAKEYGYASQSQMLIEEMAELTQAISKLTRAAAQNTTKTNEYKELFGNIAEEMADVQIMLLQIQYLLELSGEELEERMNNKIERQLKRIEED